METKIKNYLLVFGLGIITLTSCNHSKEQDIDMSTRTIHIGKSRRRNIQKFWNAKKITERHTTWASRCIAAMETVIV